MPAPKQSVIVRSVISVYSRAPHTGHVFECVWPLQPHRLHCFCGASACIVCIHNSIRVRCI